MDKGGISGDRKILDLTMQYADDVLLSCTLETCVILLTSVTPINLIKKKPGF